MDLPDVVHDETERKFSVTLGNDTAYLSYHRIDRDTLSYAHVWVPVAHRNKGVAAAVTLAALNYAATAGLRVVPACPYVAAYIRRHPRFSDLVRPTT